MHRSNVMCWILRVVLTHFAQDDGVGILTHFAQDDGVDILTHFAQDDWGLGTLFWAGNYLPGLLTTGRIRLPQRVTTMWACANM